MISLFVGFRLHADLNLPCYFHGVCNSYSNHGLNFFEFNITHML